MNSATIYPNVPLQDRFLSECDRLGIMPTTHHVIVSIPMQKLFLFQDKNLLKTYSVSTSTNPPSCQENSYGTPWGMHQIVEKIGYEVETGMVFKNRKPTGKFFWESPDSTADTPLVTSRILRLQGLEAGFNQGPGVDSFERYIYIHGTNREHLIGTAVSMGCINLRNEEVVELFDIVPEQSLVWISKLN